MKFLVRSLVIAVLATLVGLTYLTQYGLLCPSPRFEVIGNTSDGKAIAVFDSCLGMAYATPIAGLDLFIRPQAHKENTTWQTH